MTLVSDKWTWVPYYFFLAGMLSKKYRPGALKIIAGAALAVGLTDFLAARIIKPLVARLRPCHVLTLHLPTGCGGKYGFVSNHSANAFALLAFLRQYFSCFSTHTKLFLTGTLIIFATLNAFSRVYLGVHYPSDVICGAALGVLVAHAVKGALKALETRPSG
ncbi:MAG: phosphatase PAP2 family protein [Bacteroidia bacterium]|nr:phosphatase PAP2 family protein [Bacteroidia bacterium]